MDRIDYDTEGNVIVVNEKGEKVGEIKTIGDEIIEQTQGGANER